MLGLLLFLMLLVLLLLVILAIARKKDEISHKTKARRWE